MHDCITANIRNYLDTDLRPYCPALKYTQHNLACQHLYIIIINANLLPATHPVLFNVGLIVLPLREKGTLTLNRCSQKDDKYNYDLSTCLSSSGNIQHVTKGVHV